MNNAKPLTSVVVGAMNLDVVATAATPAQTGDSTPGSVNYYAGGVGRNIAETLTRLGIDTRLHSLVGDDNAGTQLLTLCEQVPMNISHVARLAGRSTDVYVSVNDSDGEMLHAVSDMKLIDESCVDDFCSLHDAVPQAALCVIDANLPETLIQHVVDVVEAGSHSILAAEAVSVRKCVRLKPFLKKIGILKVNLHEAAALACMEKSTPPQWLAEALLLLGPSKVVLTMGGDGILLAEQIDGRTVVHTAYAPKTTVVSVNGAGDALFAAVLAAMLHGHSLRDQLQWGINAATLSLQSAAAGSEFMSVEQLQRMQ